MKLDFFIPKQSPSCSSCFPDSSRRVLAHCSAYRDVVGCTFWTVKMHKALKAREIPQLCMCKQTLERCNLIGLQNSCSGTKPSVAVVPNPSACGGWTPPNYTKLRQRELSDILQVFCLVGNHTVDRVTVVFLIANRGACFKYSEENKRSV